MEYDDTFYQLGHWLLGLCIFLIIVSLWLIIHSRKHLHDHLKQLSERRRNLD